MAQPYNTFPDVQMADGEQALLPLAPGKHKRMNLNALAIVINLLLPWCFFCFICYALSFTWHYQAPVFAWSSVLLGLGIAALSGKLAFRSDESDPKWYTFFTFAMLAAVLLAVACGEWNYRTYNEAVYDLENMNAYPNVNPAALKGQQLMDAGRLYFMEGSALDLKKAMSFKNDDTYCVAPIVVGKDQMPSYDYWAVGMNCCPGQSPDFRCGEYNNAHARAGLRLMSPFGSLELGEGCAQQKEFQNDILKDRAQADEVMISDPSTAWPCSKLKPLTTSGLSIPCSSTGYRIQWPWPTNGWLLEPGSS